MRAFTSLPDFDYNPERYDIIKSIIDPYLDEVANRFFLHDFKNLSLLCDVFNTRLQEFKKDKKIASSNNRFFEQEFSVLNNKNAIQRINDLSKQVEDGESFKNTINISTLDYIFENIYKTLDKGNTNIHIEHVAHYIKKEKDYCKRRKEEIDILCDEKLSEGEQKEKIEKFSKDLLTALDKDLLTKEHYEAIKKFDTHLLSSHKKILEEEHKHQIQTYKNKLIASSAAKKINSIFLPRLENLSKEEKKETLENMYVTAIALRKLSPEEKKEKYEEHVKACKDENQKLIDRVTFKGGMIPKATVEIHPLVSRNILRQEELDKIGTGGNEVIILNNLILNPSGFDNEIDDDSSDTLKEFCEEARNESTATLVSFLEKHYADSVPALMHDETKRKNFYEHIALGHTSFADCALLPSYDFNYCVEKNITPYFFVTYIEPNDVLQKKMRAPHLTDGLLFSAVMQRNFELYQQILQKALEENEFMDFDTHLQVAFNNEDVDMISYLIENTSPNINIKNVDGQTPFHYATKQGNREIIELLIHEKADLHAKDIYGQTPFHYAAKQGNREIVELLIHEKADLHAKDIYGQTPLYSAIFENNREIVELLIHKKADLHVKDTYGQTCLLWAIYHGHTELAQLLINKNADFTGENNHGDTPLHIAALRGHTDLVVLLVMKGANPNLQNKNGSTPLHCALKEKKIKAAYYLIEKQGGINIKDASGLTPLQWTAYLGAPQIMKALIIDAKGDITFKDEEGMTLLHCAVNGNNFEMAKFLLERKVSINAQDHFGRTPLHLAAETGNENFVRLLLEKNARKTIKDALNETPFDKAKDARMKKDILELLSGRDSFSARIFGQRALETDGRGY